MGCHIILEQVFEDIFLTTPVFLALLILRYGTVPSPYNKTSDVFSPVYKANMSRHIGFSADVTTNTSSNTRLYTALAMHVLGICPNITQFTALTY